MGTYVENINAESFFIHINSNGSHDEMTSDKRDSFGLQFDSELCSSYTGPQRRKY